MRTFFDTNILVYAVDEDEPQKARTAREILERETESGNAVLSTQVLQEFYVTVTRKLGRPLAPEAAERAVRDLATLAVTIVDPPMIQSAIDRSRAMTLSFWDALILEAALASGAQRLYTEDLHAGLEVNGLVVENPFS